MKRRFFCLCLAALTLIAAAPVRAESSEWDPELGIGEPPVDLWLNVEQADECTQTETAYLQLDESLAQMLESVEDPRQELVRLHVVASDDSDEAQALKLKVRNAALDEARRLLADCDSAELAYARLTATLPALEQAALDEARRQGYEGPVRAETGIFEFPDRDYGGVVVPAGRYRALRIVIGEGSGHNWWCVLYPTLCNPDGVEYHSIFGQWLNQLFGGEGA